MKKLHPFIFFMVFAIGFHAYGGSYYVAPNGNDSNSGSLNNPFRTLQHAIGQVQPGDFIYLRGGTYNVASTIVIDRAKSGSSGALIGVYAYQGETPVLNFSAQSENSSNRGIVLDAHFWHFKGVVIEKAGDNGMLLSGNNNIIEDCIFRANRDTGLQLSRYNTAYNSISEWPSNNLILNCESYDNRDSDNEDADGFAAKLTVGTGNVFRGCVARHNIDDGWDLYTKSGTGAIGAVTLEDCIAHSNGTLTTGGSSGNGDKNGFKLGGENIAVDHIVKRCIAFNNGKHGFTYNRNVGTIQMINCTGYNNAERNFNFDGGTSVFINNLSFETGSNDRIIGNASAPNAFDNNDNWGFSVTNADFQTLSQGANANPTANGFLNLASGSDLIDAGTNVSGITYNGSAPDLGAVEYGGSSQPSTFSLTVNSSPSAGGDISKNPDKGSYNVGEVVTLTASPNGGFNFSHWSGGVSGTALSATVTINSNMNVTANFTADDGNGGNEGDLVLGNNLSITGPGPGADGSGKASGTSYGNVIDGDNSTVWGATGTSGVNVAVKWSSAVTANTVVIREDGNNITGWQLENKNGSILASGTTVGAEKLIQFSSTSTDKLRFVITSATANPRISEFEVYNATGSPGEGGTSTFALTTAVNGQGSVNPSGGEFEEGTAISLSATAAAGWEFDSWGGDASGNQNPLVVTMNGNKAVTANFIEQASQQCTPFAIQAEAGSYSTGSVDNNHSGYTGSGFVNTDNAIGEWLDFSVNTSVAGNASIAVRYALGATDERSASILVNGNEVIAYLDFPQTNDWTDWREVQFNVNLNSGSNIVRLKALNSGGLANIDKADVCIQGGSTPENYTLSTIVNGSGSVTPSNGTFVSGTTVTLTATAASGWEFDSWSGDASGNQNPLTITMSGNKSITATFIETGGSNPGNPDNSMVGYATVSGEGYNTTTGGQGGTSITISSLSQLQSWASSRENNTTPEIVYISGKISASSTTVVTIKHGANISILGLGSTAELQNVGLNIRNYKNVIVRNLKIHEVFYPNDGLTIDECQHVWVDHCEFHSKIGAGIGVDTYDGLLDIKKGSRYVTVSWNHFHDHMKTVLIGHTDNASQGSTDSQMRITMHHNFFENTDGRNPSLRWGAVHMYNNYLKNIADYGIAVRQGAHALLENNVYENVKLPITTDKFQGEGYACERGNVFIGTSGANSITQTDCGWWNTSNLPYSYTLDPVSSVSSIVPANVGVGKIDVMTTATAEPVVASFRKQVGETVEKGFVYYPNPYRGQVTFEVDLKKKDHIKIFILNSYGIKIEEIENGEFEAGRHVIQYANASLGKGVYFYVIETQKEIRREKFLVE